MPVPEQSPQPIAQLEERRFDADWGLHIGQLSVGAQRLRVAIRPRAARADTLAEAPPLLLFNGIGANLELAGPLMSALAGIETLIFDVPGAGQSPPPSWPYRLSSLARLTKSLLDRLGYATVDVLGVSWGGGLAQQFAYQCPRRVRRLVLAATSPGSLMLPAHPRVLLNMIDPRRYSDALYMHAIAPDLYGGDMRSDPQAIALFAAHARSGSALGYRYQLLAMLGWSSLPWLWRIQQPSLVLAGRDDPLVPLLNARLLAWLLRNAQLQVIDDGHLFMLTRAHETARRVAAFLGAA